MTWQIDTVDPQGDTALRLLAHAAAEARLLYADLFAADAPPATNGAATPRSVYLVAHENGSALGCGALRAVDDTVAEVRRLYVLPAARRQGLARALLTRLEGEARVLGYHTLCLETGNRQAPAIALYEACGWRRIAAFGPHVGDPTSVCFGKLLAARPAG